MRTLLPLLLLAGCQQAAPVADTPGRRLEEAAVTRGLIADPNGGTLTGSWASDSDRMCIVPAGAETRIGVMVDYGEGQGCTAAGTVERRGDRLRVRFDECRFDASFDGERIAFPATLPAACDRLCSGRASLTAVSVTQLSESASEAAALRGPDGRSLCTSSSSPDAD